jgi:hypothetical protein
MRRVWAASHRCRSFASGLSVGGRRLIDEDRHTVADDLRVGEVKCLLVARLAEEPLAASQHDRVDHQPELVDEVVLDQRLY